MTTDTTAGQRFVVVGTSGTGKTTFARQLSERLHIKHIELDSIYWQANWTPIKHDLLRQRVLELTDDERWIIDGNYSDVRDIVWARADTIIWLDFARWLVMWRILKRTFERASTQKQLWNGNRESLNKVFARDSIILWAWQTYPMLKERYMTALQNPAYAHLNFIRLTSPQMAQRWLANEAIRNSNHAIE